MRVAPPRVFPEAALAPKPPAGSPGADAHRQAGFVLGVDLETVLEGLRLEGAIAAASAGAKYRTQLTTSALALWSRAWLCRLEALHAVEYGNYAAAFPLVRAAADHQAAEISLLRTDAAEWQQWLDEGGIALAPADHATEFRLHSFRAAEVLAAHDDLGPIYRAAMDLSLSHFGSSLLLAGADSSPDRVLVTFGDRDFHLGLAELLLGWLLTLGAVQLETAAEFPGAFALPDAEAAANWPARARKLAAGRDRCRLDVVERDGQTRYLVQNWRQKPGAAPKRILL
ncbi:MAG: hypothetical protein ACM3S1_05470 [Hyphomicrobiales bacterium]